MGSGNGDTAPILPSDPPGASRMAVIDRPAHADELAAMEKAGVIGPARGSSQGTAAAQSPPQPAATPEPPMSAAEAAIARRHAANQVASDKEAARQAPVLVHLLRMADSYAAAHQMRQATEAYFEIMQRGDDTPVGDCARQRLMAIAEQYEHDNKFHQARSLFERLL